MKLSQFQFTLPEKLIAQHPTNYRDEARLMVVDRASGKISHHRFDEFFNFFETGDTVVLNDSKVLPALLNSRKERSSDKIEVLLLRELDADNHLWAALIEPARKIRTGNKLYFDHYALSAEVVDNTISRGRTIKFSYEGSRAEFYGILHEVGKVPLPPQIKREKELPEDKERYQTVYARKSGAVVAPDGGLHFTNYMIKKMELLDINCCFVTLHANSVMLKKLEIQDLGRYTLTSELHHIPQESCTAVNKSLRQQKKVCAVGTPTLRSLESSINSEGMLKATNNWTNKFIHPPYTPTIVNTLLTNFHMPRTIPFVNSLAFGGSELMMEVYHTAIKEKYRFFVYGDALLIL